MIATATALCAFATTAAMADTTAPLAGVSDHETSFQSTRGTPEYFLGHGDVIFVRAQTDRWYRLVLNEGCTRGLTRQAATISFDADASGRVDRSSRVLFSGDSGRTCLIDSIRRSEAPPQVDSKSVVTLD